MLTAVPRPPRHGRRAARARRAIRARRAARRRQRDRSDDRRGGDDRGRLSAHELDRRRQLLADARPGPCARRDRCLRRGRCAGLDRLVSRSRRRGARFRFAAGSRRTRSPGPSPGWGLAHTLSRRALRGPHAVRAAARRRDLLREERRAGDGEPGLGDGEEGGRAARRSRATRRRFSRAARCRRPGTLFAQPRVAATLERIARSGRRRLLPRRACARDRARPRRDRQPACGCAISSAHHARLADPLAVRHKRGHALQHEAADAGARVAAHPRRSSTSCACGRTGPASPEFVHLCVEATKQAFGVRDRYIEDPRYMSVDARKLLLARSFVRKLASQGEPPARGAVGRGRATAARVRATRCGWASSTKRAARSRSSRASITSSAAARCSSGRASTGRTAAAAFRSTSSR